MMGLQDGQFFLGTVTHLWLFHIAGLGFGLGLGFRGFSLWLQVLYVECSHCTDPDSDPNPNGCIGNPSPNPSPSPAM